jgi:hypothetical protein
MLCQSSPVGKYYPVSLSWLHDFFVKSVPWFWLKIELAAVSRPSFFNSSY